MVDLGEGQQQQPPTYYANFVTSNFNVDELVMELRRVDTSHRETFAGQSNVPFTVIPPLVPADIMKREPVARVVMTFSAAKGLKEYLDSTFPLVEEARRTGNPIQ